MMVWQKLSAMTYGLFSTYTSSMGKQSMTNFFRPCPDTIHDLLVPTQHYSHLQLYDEIDRNVPVLARA